MTKRNQERNKDCVGCCYLQPDNQCDIQMEPRPNGRCFANPYEFEKREKAAWLAGSGRSRPIKRSMGGQEG